MNASLAHACSPWLRLMLLTLLALCTACTTTRLDKFEQQLDTDSELKFEFHRIVDDPNGLGLRFPGLVLGFEKADRELIGCHKLHTAEFKRRIALDHATGGKPSTVRAQLEDRLDDGKCIFLSHAVRYHYDPNVDGIDAQFLYRSVYPEPFTDPEGPEEPENGLSEVKSAYDESWKLLTAPAQPMPEGRAQQADTKHEGSAVRAALEEAVSDGKHTHIIVYTMGWNSGETEALRNVNSLHLALLHGARKAGVSSDRFNPYPVLVTWPSHWPWYFGPFSYFNKANDADELGAVFLNAIVHKLVLPVAQANRLRTIAIGHSFGGRALSRALASRSILVGATSKARWDLLIGLQAAFSINRFAMIKGSWEGAPYRRMSQDVAKTVLTWSKHDTANRQALWSNHAGGDSGGERAAEINAAYEAMGKPPIFDRQLLCAAKDADSYDRTVRNRVLYLDASELVKFENYVKAGGAHSDIYTEEIGRVVSGLVQRFAP